eukprot:c4312_g1_i1.p1 GENE.c4312_g1_i1~~c4312_g1_i1.p1  ORF type:complete len:291 (+),score=66.16 c4312_g1_i1:55-927(+)
MDSEEKADALVEKAEKRMKGGTFGFLSSRTSRLEEAEEDLQKAANLYKLAKKWDKAGETFRKLASVSMNLGNKHQAATAYTDAANSFRKTRVEDAVDSLRKASEIYTDIGKFSPAAKVQKEIGEILEAEGDKEEAIKAYDTAADYFSGENSQSLANGCRLKSASLYALCEKYDKAIEIFEQVGMSSVDSPLTKFNAKDYFFKAGLCHICTGDIVGAERSIQKYGDWDVTFNSQREYKLLTAILEAHKQFELDEFTNAVADYDAISKLDNWKTTILLRIKEAIKSGQVDVL